MIPTEAQEILDFWFGPSSDSEFGQPKPAWFIKQPAFDQAIRDRFLELHQQAIANERDAWQEQPDSCLALLIVLDQFSRNLFRGRPQAFGADPKALAIAKRAVQQAFDQQLHPIQRWFVYLPFEHSEAWSDQQRSLELWESLKFHAPSADSIQYAYQHAEVIQRFGRFPPPKLDPESPEYRYRIRLSPTAGILILKRLMSAAFYRPI